VSASRHDYQQKVEVLREEHLTEITTSASAHCDDVKVDIQANLPCARGSVDALWGRVR
jgi:hypothetical protein